MDNISFDDLIPGATVKSTPGNVDFEDLIPKNKSSHLAPATGEAALRSREPDWAEWIADKTGTSSDYWRRTLWNLKAPERVLEGAEAPAQGIVQGIVHAGTYLAPNALGEISRNVDTRLQRQEEQYKTERANAGVEPGTIDYSRGLGTVISPVTATTGQLGAAAALGRNVLSRLGTATVTGAAIGAEQPVTSGPENYAAEKTAQAVTGAAIGAGAETAGTVVGPWMRAQAQHLIDRYNIRVPFGKSLGDYAGRFEEATQSIPGSGYVVRSAYNTANQDLVRAANNEVSAELEPYGFGFRLNQNAPLGRQTAVDRGDQLAASYNDVIPRLRGEADPQFMQDIAVTRQRLSGMAPARVADYDAAINGLIFNNTNPAGPMGRVLQNVRLDGQNLKNADVDLRDNARRYMQSNGPANDYNLGEALRDTRAALRDMWTRHSAPEDIAQLNATDAAYGMHKVIERAESSSAAPEGVFGPTQFYAAVKAADRTLGKRALTRGETRFSDLADTAKTVLGKTVADSGTPERVAAMGAYHLLTTPSVVTGAGALGAAIPTATALLGHAAAYSPIGQNILRSIAQGSQPAANALRQLAPGIAAISAAHAPYDNKPKTEREWQAQYQQRAQAANQAQSYYGQGR